MDQGWLRTGDLAYKTPEGNFVLAGRTTEMYIRGGYNIFPLEVESVLSELPLISEIVIIPKADEVMGEIGVAVVALTEMNSALTLDDLRSYGQEKLAAYKLPEKILFADSIPRNATDKIDRRKLKDLVKQKLG